MVGPFSLCNWFSFRVLVDVVSTVGVAMLTVGTVGIISFRRLDSF